MTEENTAGVVVQEVSQAAQEAAKRDFETEAKDIGWVPESEFKGPKEKWKPAQQFVEDGEKILPIVRSQLNREKEAREKERADFAKRLERMERMSNTAVERLKAQHKSELDRIQNQKLAAVEAGDTDEYKRLDKQEKDLAKTTFEEPVVETKDDFQKKLDKFSADNPWYTSNDVMAAYADHVSQTLARENPAITFEENARQTIEKIKAKFPEQFKQPAANGHAAVDGGGDFPGPGAGKSSLEAKLPAEALKQAKADVAAKLYPNVEAWAKVYFG